MVHPINNSNVGEAAAFLLRGNDFARLTGLPGDFTLANILTDSLDETVHEYATASEPTSYERHENTIDSHDTQLDVPFDFTALMGGQPFYGNEEMLFPASNNMEARLPLALGAAIDELYYFTSFNDINIARFKAPDYSTQRSYQAFDIVPPLATGDITVDGLQHATNGDIVNNNAMIMNGTGRARRHVPNIPPCSGATFGRGHELRRHHASKHDLHNARFFCPVDGCERSKKERGRAFPRKDKMVDHLMRVHGDMVGTAA